MAAALLVDAPADRAQTAWSRAGTIPAGRCGDQPWTQVEELRPLLETAVGDADAWVRWRALRGLVKLGPEPGRLVVEPLAEDPDFRVRLEAVAVLRG